MFSPSHHLMAIWCSLGSKLRPRPGDGTTEGMGRGDRQETSLVTLNKNDNDKNFLSITFRQRY